MILNKISFMVGKIWHAFSLLNQLTTFCINILVNVHLIKECPIECLSPRYRHSSSALIPNLNNSFLVTIVLWINLK